ncbi:MAG: hypothetical protein ORN29_09740 [Rhodoferax sp.]|nr:hypothetical protein [Rhodoferax sp.]
MYSVNTSIIATLLLAGTHIFADSRQIQDTQHYCSIRYNLNYDYKLLASAIPELLGGIFKEMEVTKRLFFEPLYCYRISNNKVLLSPIDKGDEILLIQRSAVAALSREIRLDGFEQLGTLAFADVKLALEKIQKGNQDETQIQLTHKTEQAIRETELNHLAVVKSKEKIAAITLNYPKSKYQSLNLCTRNGGLDFEVPAMGYFATNELRLSKGFIDAVDKTSSPALDRQNPYRHMFDDLDAFYIAWQKNKEICQIYVDYPENIKTFLDAAKRDGLNQFELNPLVDVAVLKHNWAQLQGFTDYAEYEFSKEINASGDLLNSLKTFNIVSSASFNAIAQKMIHSGYAKERNAKTLLAYLQDDAEGKKKDKSANTVKAVREKSEAESAAIIASLNKQHAKNYAKKYPYYAVLSCELANKTMPLIGCFSRGGELMLRQGNVEQANNVLHLLNNQIGRLEQDSLYIDLQPGYFIRAQNGAYAFTLTLRVYYRATNKLKVQRQAGSLWAVVSDRD